MAAQMQWLRAAERVALEIAKRNDTLASLTGAEIGRGGRPSGLARIAYWNLSRSNTRVIWDRLYHVRRINYAVVRRASFNLGPDRRVAARVEAAKAKDAFPTSGAQP